MKPKKGGEQIKDDMMMKKINREEILEGRKMTDRRIDWQRRRGRGRRMRSLHVINRNAC